MELPSPIIGVFVKLMKSRSMVTPLAPDQSYRQPVILPPVAQLALADISILNVRHVLSLINAPETAKL